MVDWDAEEYARVSGLQRSVAEVSLQGLLLDGSERLLDVGCGDGYVTLLLAARLPRGSVVGVDASPRMIAKARSRKVPDGASVRFAVADARRLPFTGEFDVVVSFNALHWVAEQRRALSSIAHAATPGGRVIIQVVCASERPSLEAVAMTVCGSPGWSERFGDFVAPFTHIDPRRFPDLAESAGLEVSDLQVRDLEWDFGSREAFTRWCTVGFADWTARLRDTEVTRFMSDIVAAYEQVTGVPGLFRFTQLCAALRPTPAGTCRSS